MWKPGEQHWAAESGNGKVQPWSCGEKLLVRVILHLILVQAINIVQIRIFLRFEGDVFNVCCECHRISLIVWDAHFLS